jgi:hypothetical protein
MRGKKGTAKAIGDPCADCRAKLTAETAVPRAGKGRSGLMSYCRTCFNARARATRNKTPETARLRNRQYRVRLRLEVVAAMGGRCRCCGETTPEFLAIDHVNGGGGKERRLLKNSSTGMYLRVKKLGYPKEYQLLCHNCNCAKAWYGRCPHQRP